jgi:geranylgeranyl diphosphate synthase type II
MDFQKQIDGINERIRQNLNDNVKSEKIREVIEYSLKDGKRWRPIIFLSLFDTSNITLEDYPILNMCYIFVEYIHNASLMIDDLPMMDNDDMRRDKLTVHKKYDEATSKLAALQLMILSYYNINRAFVELKNSQYFSDYNELSLFYNKINTLLYSYMGDSGLCVGQLIDLSTSEKTLDEWLKMVHNKTSSLFILSFTMGYIFSRKSLDHLEEINKIGEYFGYIYQILDDFEDYEQDKKRNYTNNILFIVSKEKATELVKFYFTEMINLINKHKIGCKSMKEICKLLKSKWLKTKTIC